MLDEPGGALRAAESVPASAAKRERSITAPVQEKQRLLARREHLGHRRDEGRRKPTVLRWQGTAQIDGGNVGKRAPCDPIRQV